MMRFARDTMRTLIEIGHPIDARALSTLVQGLLPILYDPTVVDAMREKVEDPSAVLIGFPVATRCVAEAVMAGADGRETRYFTPQPNRQPEGALSLPQPPNSGIDPTGERTAESFREHLRRKWTVANLTDFENAFYRCMSEFVDLDLREALRMSDNSELWQMAADNVQYLAEHESSRHYYLFRLPEDSEGRMSCLATIQKLKQEFSAIAFLELSGDAKLMRGENFDFLPLKHILTVTED